MRKSTILIILGVLFVVVFVARKKTKQGNTSTVASNSDVYVNPVTHHVTIIENPFDDPASRRSGSEAEGVRDISPTLLTV